MQQSCNFHLFIYFYQIFFRANVLQTLESQRDEKLSGIFTQLQSRCRGYLARKDYAKRKVNDIAVRCIQRNVKKFMVVRDWPWWRLLVRITPLLNVHRTEYELKQKYVSSVRWKRDLSSVNHLIRNRRFCFRMNLSNCGIKWTNWNRNGRSWKWTTTDSNRE